VSEDSDKTADAPEPAPAELVEEIPSSEDSKEPEEAPEAVPAGLEHDEL